MINTLETKVGDCCYFLLQNDRKIRFGTIVKVIRRESAVSVTDSLEHRYHVVWEKNAAWEEKELKGQKWEKPHNYHRDIPEVSDEKELDKGIGTVHNRTKRKRKSRRTKKSN
jgi:hypothetical protein